MSNSMSMTESLYRLYLASIKDEDNLCGVMGDTIVNMDIREIATIKHNIERVRYVVKLALARHLAGLGFRGDISDKEIAINLESKWEVHGCIFTIDEMYPHTFSEFQRKGDLALFNMMNNCKCMLLCANKEVK